MKSFIIFAVFSGAFAQQLINLNTFTGEGQKNLIPGNAPYAIYVSAYPDSTATLKSIYVFTGDGMVHRSLYDLKNNYFNQNSGVLQPFEVNTNAYLTTNLTTNDLKTLQGVMFITSTAQLNDKNFFVIDIWAVDTFSEETQRDLTIFFLNTLTNTNPYQSSIISQWAQDENTTAYIYQGIPTDDVEEKNYQIFSNPVVTANSKTQFFPTVEKFSLSLRAFYMKTSKGVPGFRIEPGYYTAQGTTTSQYTTTGFYMKAKGQTDSLYTVHCRRDTKSSGTSGMNMLGSLPTGKKITYGVYDGDSKWEESSVANSFFSPWSIPLIGENFQISSDGGNDAQYFVQYYTVQTVTSTTTAITTSGTSSTQNIITSTKTATTSATTAMSTMSPTTTPLTSSTNAPSTSIAPTSGSIAVTSTTATTTSATSTLQNLVTSTKTASTSPPTTTNTPTTLPGSSSTAAPTTSTILPTTFGGVTTTGNVETTTKSTGTTRLVLLVALISLIGL